MCCREPSCLLRQRGAALITALLVFAISSALMVGLQRDFTLTMQRGTHHLFSEQAWAYLMGAEALAMLALRADSKIDARADIPSDSLKELWAQSSTPYPLDAGGWLSGEIEDLQGRFNLNMLAVTMNQLEEGKGERSGEIGSRKRSANTGSPWTDTQKMFIRLLQALYKDSLSLDEALSLTEAIIDFIDSDSDRRSEGAEEGDYQYTAFPYLPANRALASVSELRAVQGMTAELYEALAPFVTVWPQENARLNILTAPFPVIRSLNGVNQLEPMAIIEAERLVNLRERGAISTVDDFLSDPAFEGKNLGDLNKLLVVRSSWFLLKTKVQLLERERGLLTVLNRTDGNSIPIFRSEGEL